MNVICSWRLEGVEFNESQLELIATYKPDVLALQHINKSYYTALNHTGYFKHSAFHPSSSGDCCAVFSQFPLCDYQINAPLLKETPLVKYIALPSGMATFVVFSAQNYKSLDLSVLSQLSGPVIACVAALPTRFDMSNFCFDTDELYEPHKILSECEYQGMGDVYHRWVKTNPNLVAAKRKLRPRGPLVVDSLSRRQPRCSTEFVLANRYVSTYVARYYLTESCAVGASYALVTATLMIDRSTRAKLKAAQKPRLRQQREPAIG